LIKYIIKALRGTSKVISLNVLNDLTASIPSLRRETMVEIKNKTAKI
jgi:hypothetical protein